ncbi:hypothetical protein PIB30_052365 [Stylosanthes scabra]|uniref:Uncharacterized protein n=1 Tax=Stylosanthes scabra TaxID=79078 RepID=A0ABU6TJC3_9FABA|nr:hypothetical protein [Stylosanthes scabra]
MVGDSHSVYVETFQVQVQAWKVAKHVVSCYGLVSPVGQVIRCESSVCNVTISAERVRGAVSHIRVLYLDRRRLGVVPIIPPSIASSSFAADLHYEDDGECDLEDNRTFGEIVTAVANNPRIPLRGVQISKPEGVEEVLCDDEEDEEPELIADDSDDNDQSIPVLHCGPASSGSHQYP